MELPAYLASELEALENSTAQTPVSKGREENLMHSVTRPILNFLLGASMRDFR